MKRSEFIPAIGVAVAAGCAGGAAPLSQLLTPQSRGIVAPNGTTPLHTWKEYNCGRFRLIGPFTGQRKPTVYFNVIRSSTQKLCGSMNAVFGLGGPLLKPFMTLTLTIDGKSVSETFTSNEEHILKWLNKHPHRAFEKLWKLLQNENNKTSIAMLMPDGRSEHIVMTLDGNDGTLHFTDYSILYHGKPLTGSGPWLRYGEMPEVSAACLGAQLLCLAAFLELLQGAPAAGDPATAGPYAIAVGLFGILVEQTATICSQ